MSRSYVLVPVLALATSIVACGKTESKPAAPPPASAPAAAAAAPPKPGAAAPAAGQKPAQKKSLPAAKQPRPVPTDWIELTDSVRGFSFSVPAGSVGNAEDKNGFLGFAAVLPKPYDKVVVMTFAFKDAKRSLDDLAHDAESILGKVLDEGDIKVTATKDITDDYRLLEITSADTKDKSKNHWKVLLATDVTDNYILITGTPESEFAANEPTMDSTWGSFDMLSGGFSGESKLSRYEKRI
jgi:hypothetical protein